MGVHEGRGLLAKGFKELMLRWHETKGSWDDAVSDQFEKTYLEPLERDLKSAGAAMDQMNILLYRIRQECGDR
jgi:hypothetical protein